MRRRGWPITLILILMSQAVPSAGIAQTPIEGLFKNVANEQTADAGKRVLFLRRGPVVAAAIGFDREQLGWMSSVVTTYAKANGLSISFSNERSNLILIRTQDTHRGAKLNPDALLRYGFGEHIIALMSEVEIWASGCGIYNFRDRDGSISTSIGLVDTELNADDQNACGSLIIAGAFGIGGGLTDHTSIPREQNTYRNALALTIASECDRENRSSSADRVRQYIAANDDHIRTNSIR